MSERQSSKARAINANLARKPSINLEMLRDQQRCRHIIAIAHQTLPANRPIGMHKRGVSLQMSACQRPEWQEAVGHSTRPGSCAI